jgi:hypothetical protein
MPSPSNTATPLPQASDAWCNLDMWEQADVVLAFAAALVGPLCLQPLQERQAGGAAALSSSSASSESLVSLLFDVHLARYITAAKLNHQV